MGKQILQVQFEGQWGKEIRPCFLISKSYFSWGISPQRKLYPLLSLPRCGQAFVPGQASFLSLLLFSEKLGFKAEISTAESTLELISNTPHLSDYIQISHCLSNVHVGSVIQCLSGDGHPGHRGFRDVLHPALLTFLPGLRAASTDTKRIWPWAFQGAPSEGERMYKPVKKQPSSGLQCKLALRANSMQHLLCGAAFMLHFGWLTVSRSQLFSSHLVHNFIPAPGALSNRTEKKRQSVSMRQRALWDA